MEKRNLFQKIFKTTQNKTFGTQLELLGGQSAIFTPFTNRLYDTTTVRSCIDAIARNGAKMSPKHIRSNETQYISLNNAIKRLISEQPNELMNAYTFYYKIISTLYLDNNAFVYIQKDSKGIPTGLYPLKAGSYKLVEYKNKIFVQFSFTTGRAYTVPYEDLIHLKRFYCENDILGGGNAPIVEAMSFKHILQEGIKNAIKTTQGIKGILKTTKSMLKPEDVLKARNDFVNDFINSQNGSGIAGLDATMDFKEVNINPQTATDAQSKEINDEIKNYYGISDEIIQSKYSEEQWNAFYESVLEPIGLQMSLEFTNKLFTLGERQHGNKIIFEANRLQYASNATKISIVEKANNIMTINEMREIFNLAPVPDGDKIMQDLNHIDSTIANDYQGGGTNEE